MQKVVTVESGAIGIIGPQPPVHTVLDCKGTNFFSRIIGVWCSLWQKTV